MPAVQSFLKRSLKYAVYLGVLAAGLLISFSGHRDSVRAHTEDGALALNQFTAVAHADAPPVSSDGGDGPVIIVGGDASAEGGGDDDDDDGDGDGDDDDG